MHGKALTVDDVNSQEAKPLSHVKNVCHGQRSMSSLFPFYGYSCLVIIKEDFSPFISYLNVVSTEVICNGSSVRQMEYTSPHLPASSRMSVL